MPMTGRTTVSEALKTILICIDSYDDLRFSGVLFHSSLQEGIPFSNLMQLLFLIENILNDIGFPKAATERRRFSAFEREGTVGEAANAKVDFQTKAGKLATFKLKVMFRQNASWQGAVGWIEGNSEEPFRSALELIMLMDSALNERKAK